MGVEFIEKWFTATRQSLAVQPHHQGAVGFSGFSVGCSLRPKGGAMDSFSERNVEAVTKICKMLERAGVGIVV
jgi:hypothetical protein